MTLTQAILLGCWYWLYTCSLGYGFLNFMQQTIFACLGAGLILGDVPTAMKVAAVVQPMYMAFMGAGGTVAVDQASAGLVSAAVVITSGGSVPVEQATIIAVPVALLCAQLHTIRRITAAAWVHMADRYAEKLNYRGIYLAGLVYTNLWKIVIFWIPMSIGMYFGAESIANLMRSLPEWLTNGLSVVSTLMPALGFADRKSVV